MKTAFFGPFIGELGWELLYWQGWVRKFCEDNPNVFTIACSRSGRECFYPFVKEFKAIPDEFFKNNFSSKSYISDFWSKDDLPVYTQSSNKKFFIFDQQINLKTKSDFYYEEEFKNLKKKMTESLPKDATIYDPTSINKYEQIFFGTKKIVSKQGNLYKSIPVHFKNQSFSKLKPVGEARKYIEQFNLNPKKTIAIFPRKRDIRRPDKNWPKSYYYDLINIIQNNLSDYKILLIGYENGAYFKDEKVKGTIDLINIPNSNRLNIHVAALSLSTIALGSLSGAILFALASGVQSVTWGPSNSRFLVYYENEKMLNSPLIYYPNINISPEIIFKIMDNMLGGTYDQISNWEKFKIENKFKDGIKDRIERTLGNFFFTRNKHWIDSIEI